MRKVLVEVDDSTGSSSDPLLASAPMPRRRFLRRTPTTPTIFVGGKGLCRVGLLRDSIDRDAVVLI